MVPSPTLSLSFPFHLPILPISAKESPSHASGPTPTMPVLILVHRLEGFRLSHMGEDPTEGCWSHLLYSMSVLCPLPSCSLYIFLPPQDCLYQFPKVLYL